MYRVILKLNEGEKKIIFCLESKKQLIQQASDNYNIKSKKAQKLLSKISSKNVESLYKTYDFPKEVEMSLSKKSSSILKSYIFEVEESTETIKNLKEQLGEKDKIIESYKMKNNKIENMLYEMNNIVLKLKDKKNSLASDAELNRNSLQQISKLKKNINH